jgi:hypothetical protein
MALRAAQARGMTGTRATFDSSAAPGLNSCRGPLGPSAVMTSDRRSRATTACISRSASPDARVDEPRTASAPARRMMAAGTSPLTDGLVRKPTRSPRAAWPNRYQAPKTCIWCQYTMTAGLPVSRRASMRSPPSTARTRHVFHSSARKPRTSATSTAYHRRRPADMRRRDARDWPVARPWRAATLGE